MQDFIQVLLNAILNGEVGGCEKLCSGIKNGPADLVCNLLCMFCESLFINFMLIDYR